MDLPFARDAGDAQGLSICRDHVLANPAQHDRMARCRRIQLLAIGSRPSASLRAESESPSIQASAGLERARASTAAITSATLVGLSSAKSR